jgi:AraC-like DNA-binding protein
VLNNGAAGLFGEYLRMLEARMSTLRTEDLPAIAQITMDLFAASLRPAIETIRRARPAIDATLLQRLRRHVETHLHDPNLTPEAIAGALLISRARLYGLLEGFGGVAAYVQSRRLARAYARLRAAGPVVPIKEIAYQVGFSSEAHFSRAFRRHYGCTPSEARAGEAFGADRRTNPDADLTATEILPAWLRELR